MKYLYLNILGFVVAAFAVISCSTSQTVEVSGKPGTEIYSPQKNLLTTIQPDGTSKIKIDSDSYYAYLLSKEPASEDYIPFALDYKRHNYTMDRTLSSLGTGIGLVGTGAMVMGTIMLLAGGEDVALPFIAGGAVVASGGFAVGTSAVFRKAQTQQTHRYKYLSEHKTNQDMLFTYPEIVAEENPATSEAEESAPVSVSNRKISVTTENVVTDKSSRSLKDYGAKVAGEYVGSGILRLKDDVVEKYNNIKVVVKRKDRKTVTVDVIDDAGESYFNMPSKYLVDSDLEGGYTLTHNEISQAKIEINAKKVLIYLHPRVNIDNEVYTLEIEAKKK